MQARKTAMRLVLHLLRQDTAVVEAFGNAIVTLKHEVNGGKDNAN